MYVEGNGEMDCIGLLTIDPFRRRVECIGPLGPMGSAVLVLKASSIEKY